MSGSKALTPLGVNDGLTNTSAVSSTPFVPVAWLEVAQAGASNTARPATTLRVMA